MPSFLIRPAEPDDALPLADLYTGAGLDASPSSGVEADLMIQTGNAFLLAEREGRLAGAVRYRDDEGIGWFDLLVSVRPWAGADLVRAVERGCQDRGIRLLRSYCPDFWLVQEYFARLGHLPIGTREGEILLERRLPLLTVREQRRSDAEAIGKLTGEDPWVFEQGARPGWFVAADGDRVVGVIQAADGAGGAARISVPLLLPAYRGRSLEGWMLERAAQYAETNGYHSARMEHDPSLEPVKRALEDLYWQRQGDSWRRVFFIPRSPEDGDED